VKLLFLVFIEPALFQELLQPGPLISGILEVNLWHL